ncbi:hypothetical protein [Noviherbaspirillum galbum]|uniref:Uncharacterized protein n=1 Tax=Noviherbaspirillum galbum TaxID=2709383 RepID=A0A6B3SQT1_9BURK|nr:hypothetical protein [Noviherbaspirillum galbum]NEX60019.1 hypothetical protein [Noviherbaspirillum galbum]
MAASSSFLVPVDIRIPGTLRRKGAGGLSSSGMDAGFFPCEAASRVLLVSALQLTWSRYTKNAAKSGLNFPKFK